MKETLPKFRVRHISNDALPEKGGIKTKETLSKVVSFIFFSLLIISFFSFTFGCFFGGFLKKQPPLPMIIGGIGLLIDLLVIGPIWYYVKFGAFFSNDDVDFWD